MTIQRIWAGMSVLAIGFLAMAAGAIFAPAYAKEDACPGEAQGKFCDDQLPLPIAHKTEIPSAPKDCDSGAFGSGFQEALGGQRYLTFVQTTDLKTPSERKGCQAYRSGKPEDESKLRCCNKGFLQGIEALSAKIDSPEFALSDRVKKCREEMKYGEDDAADYCMAFSQEGSGICMNFPPMRYLGCYTLGFMSVLKECKIKQGEEMAAYLKRNSVTISRRDTAKSLAGPSGSQPAASEQSSESRQAK